MGEIAEMVLDGILCESCGAMVDGYAAGYPRMCANCEKEKREDLLKRYGYYKRLIRE